LPIPAYLPEDWIPELSLRLQIYRRIANLTTRDEVGAMRDELKDRFGSLPKAVEGLLDQIEIKLMAQAAGASAILVRNKVMQIKLPYLVEINRKALQQLLSHYVDDRIEVEVTRVAVEFPLDRDGLWRDALLVILAQLGQRVRFGAGV
jgi:transcription-repair coupling factor (superfamily II helicase)